MPTQSSQATTYDPYSRRGTLYNPTTPTGNASGATTGNLTGGLTSNPFPFATPNPTWGGRGYSQLSDSYQYGASRDQQASTSYGESAYANTANTLSQSLGLTETQTQQLNQALQNLYSTTNTSTTGQTTSLPVNTQAVLKLLQTEQDYLDQDTASAQNFLSGLLSGQNTPTVDRQAYYDELTKQIQQATNTASSQSQLAGLGATDTARQQAFATEAVSSPIVQSLLNAENEMAINTLAAQTQGAETLNQGTAASRLFGDVAPSLLSQLLGESTSTSSTSAETVNSVAQTLEEQYGYSKTQSQEMAQQLVNESGSSSEFATSLTDAISESIGTAFGRIYGIAPESTKGGKFVCTIMCHHGYLDKRLLQKEVQFFTHNIKRFKWSARGYLSIGPKMALFAYRHPKIAKLFATFVRKIVSCNAKKWDRQEPTFIETLSFNSVRVLFALIGLCGAKKSFVDEQIIEIMKLYYNPVNVDILYNPEKKD